LRKGEGVEINEGLSFRVYGFSQALVVGIKCVKSWEMGSYIVRLRWWNY